MHDALIAANREQHRKNLRGLTRHLDAFEATGDLCGWRDEAMLRRKHAEVAALVDMSDAQLLEELTRRFERAVR